MLATDPKFGTLSHLGPGSLKGPKKSRFCFQVPNFIAMCSKMDICCGKRCILTWNIYRVPNFGPEKVPILYTSPQFHPYNEMPRQSPKFKILERKHCRKLHRGLSSSKYQKTCAFPLPCGLKGLQSHEYSSFPWSFQRQRAPQWGPWGCTTST